MCAPTVTPNVKKPMMALAAIAMLTLSVFLITIGAMALRHTSDSCVSSAVYTVNRVSNHVSVWDVHLHVHVYKRPDLIENTDIEIKHAVNEFEKNRLFLYYNQPLVFTCTVLGSGMVIPAAVTTFDGVRVNTGCISHAVGSLCVGILILCGLMFCLCETQHQQHSETASEDGARSDINYPHVPVVPSAAMLTEMDTYKKATELD